MNLFDRYVERPVRGLRFRLSRRLPDREPTDAWPGIESIAVTIRPFAARFGNLSRYELLVLAAAGRWAEARNLFEFGTFDGLTTWHLACNCGPEARIWTVDLPPDHPARLRLNHDRSIGRICGVGVGSQFIGTPQECQITQIYQDSMNLDSTPFRGKIDFCFIDAGHGYEHVRRDTDNALTMVRPGGLVFWHDYSRWWPGVQKCLDELSVRYPAFRVPETGLAALQMPI
jgi:hypothetical protein